MDRLYAQSTFAVAITTLAAANFDLRKGAPLTLTYDVATTYNIVFNGETVAAVVGEANITDTTQAIVNALKADERTNGFLINAATGKLSVSYGHKRASLFTLTVNAVGGAGAIALDGAQAVVSGGLNDGKHAYAYLDDSKIRGSIVAYWNKNDAGGTDLWYAFGGAAAVDTGWWVKNNTTEYVNPPEKGALNVYTAVAKTIVLKMN